MRYGQKRISQSVSDGIYMSFSSVFIAVHKAVAKSRLYDLFVCDMQRQAPRFVIYVAHLCASAKSLFEWLSTSCVKHIAIMIGH